MLHIAYNLFHFYFIVTWHLTLPPPRDSLSHCLLRCCARARRPRKSETLTNTQSITHNITQTESYRILTPPQELSHKHGIALEDGIIGDKQCTSRQ